MTRTQRESVASEVLLPADIDAEKAVLGTALVAPDRFSSIAATLTPDDFSLERHRRIYASMVDSHEAGGTSDRMSVAIRLKERGQLEQDGISYLASLDDGFSAIFDVEPAIRRVKDVSVRRRAILALDKAMKEMAMPNSDSGVISDQAQRILAELEIERCERSRLRTVTDIVEGCGGVDAFLHPKYDKDGIFWTIPRMNKTLGPMCAGELLLLAARPSVGKSALAMQQAAHAARHGKITAVFSLEMSGEELLRRAVCSESGVNAQAIRRHLAKPEERAAVSRSLGELSAMPIFLDDNADNTVTAIHAECRRMKARRGLDFVVVDYLQLIAPAGRFDNRTAEITSISRGLKLAAKDLKVPILGLSQLSRGVEQDKRRPRLSDLRDSGSLEQDADVVLFIHREDIEKPESLLIVAKQRKGPVGEIPLWFQKETTRFHEVEGGE